MDPYLLTDYWAANMSREYITKLQLWLQRYIEYSQSYEYDKKEEYSQNYKYDKKWIKY
jgi:hypothetical protein